MGYWRMQLHPSESDIAVAHSVNSLVSGYIGLDFGKDLGNLLLWKKSEIPKGQEDYWDFAHSIQINDRVLIIAHHYPVALVRVAGQYNYISNPNSLGVWFRHFREVDNIFYYADYITNPHKWQKLTMTDTISPLIDQNSLSFQLIQEWLVT